MPYTRKVQYYETDMMGIVHHANYLHWMEEARIEFMDRLGFPYISLEEKGIMSPVRSVTCEYKKACAFGDEIEVEVSVLSFNGVVLTFLYEMRSQKGETVCRARSEHVLLNREGHFVRVKRDLPEFGEAIDRAIAERESREERVKAGKQDENQV